MTSANESYDHMIAGAGTAGCVLVNRLLSADKPGDGAHKFSAFTSSVCQLRPHSRGRMEITSSDPLEYPAIHPNYLSDERNYRVSVGGVKVAGRFAEAPSLASRIIDEYVPRRQFQRDEELLHAARQYSQTIYHPTSTYAG